MFWKYDKTKTNAIFNADWYNVTSGPSEAYMRQQTGPFFIPLPVQRQAMPWSTNECIYSALMNNL